MPVKYNIYMKIHGYLSQGETGSHNVSVPTVHPTGNGNIGMFKNMEVDS